MALPGRSPELSNSDHSVYISDSCEESDLPVSVAELTGQAEVSDEVSQTWPPSRQVLKLTKEQVASNFAPNIRFALAIDEVPGGVLLGHSITGGAQGFVCTVFSLSTSKWLVRKLCHRNTTVGSEFPERGGMPSEVYFNLLLDGCKQKVPVTNSIQISDDTWAIYLEYCNAGSLKSYTNDLFNQGIDIPPLFVWYLLRDLILTMAYFRFGCSRKVEGGKFYLPDDGWHSVSHCDLHRGNVLVHFDEYVDPEHPELGKIPKFRIADLGFSVFAKENRVRLNPDHAYDDWGDTQGILECLERCMQSMDDKAHGVAELKALLVYGTDGRWPRPRDFDPPPFSEETKQVMTHHYETGLLVTELKQMDPNIEPPAQIHEGMKHCPLTTNLVGSVLPICDEAIEDCHERMRGMLDDPYLELSVAPVMTQEPELLLLKPGATAPDWIDEIVGSFRWIAVEVDEVGQVIKSLQNVEEKFVPRMRSGASTWCLTSLYDQ